MSDKRSPQPALILLDRDDTLIRVPAGVVYLYGEDPIEFLPGAVDFVRHWNSRQIPVAIVTNQQGISLADYPEMTRECVDHFHARLQSLLQAQDAHIDRFYLCPHAAADGCDCRKPKPGLIQQALLEFNVLPHHTVLLGDRPRDCDAAAAAGVPAYLINRLESGNLPEPLAALKVVSSFAEALGDISEQMDKEQTLPMWPAVGLR